MDTPELFPQREVDYPHIALWIIQQYNSIFLHIYSPLLSIYMINLLEIIQKLNALE